MDAADLEHSVLDMVKRDAVKLPPHPTVALRLQEVVARATFGTTDVVEVVSEDQSLAMTLLRYGNSARYRGVEPITSLHDAVVRIGAAEVARLAIALGVSPIAAAAGPLASLRRRWWWEAFLGAALSQQLGDARGLRRDEAFVCGLLHDYGRVVALNALEQILAQRRDTRVLPAAVWDQSVDRLHVDLGVSVAARWKLSALLRAGISSHHRPQVAGAHRRMVEVIGAADAVVAMTTTRPCVGAAELMALPVLKRDEIPALAALLPRQVGALAALDEAGILGSNPPPSSSQVAGPTPAAPAGARPTAFAIELAQAAGAQGFTATHVSPDAIELRGPTHIAEHRIVRLTARADGLPPVTFTALVVACAEDGDGHRMQARPFGLDADTAAAWARFHAAL